MKKIRMVDFLDQFEDNTRIIVFNRGCKTIYDGNVGDAPQSVWSHKNLVGCVYSISDKSFLITIEQRPFKKH